MIPECRAKINPWALPDMPSKPQILFRYILKAYHQVIWVNYKLNYKYWLVSVYCIFWKFIFISHYGRDCRIKNENKNKLQIYQSVSGLWECLTQN